MRMQANRVDARADLLRAGQAPMDLGQGASASWLSGGRLFLQHGPINLVVRAEGAAAAVTRAYAGLMRAFPGWLGTLVEELPVLRSPLRELRHPPRGDIALRMFQAADPHRSGFITCMAAVAGAVADQAVALLAAVPGIHRAYVNNGGDIALHLAPAARMAVGVVPRLHEAVAGARVEIDAASPVRGIATSGWDGRSHSLGIADAVSVLAGSAAAADAAATVIANSVNVAHPGIRREAARVLDEDSDLGERLVTVHVPCLSAALVRTALDAGLARAATLHANGTIEGAALCLQGQWRVLGVVQPATGLDHS